MASRPWAAIGAFAVFVAGCGERPDPAVAAAADICEQLDAANTPLERRVAQEDLLARSGAGGSESTEPTIIDVLTAMNERCPSEAAGLLGIGEGDHDVRMTVDQCDDNETSGTVTNDGDETVTVRIGVRIVDEDDTLLDTSSALVDGLEPGQKGRWEAYHSVDDAGFTCKGEIEQVTPG
jgi:hypothetical protein